jgi:hypothetical protein
MWIVRQKQVWHFLVHLCPANTPSLQESQKPPRQETGDWKGRDCLCLDKVCYPILLEVLVLEVLEEEPGGVNETVKPVTSSRREA